MATECECFADISAYLLCNLTTIVQEYLHTACSYDITKFSSHVVYDVINQGTICSQPDDSWMRHERNKKYGIPSAFVSIRLTTFPVIWIGTSSHDVSLQNELVFDCANRSKLVAEIKKADKNFMFTDELDAACDIVHNEFMAWIAVFQTYETKHA